MGGVSGLILIGKVPSIWKLALILKRPYHAPLKRQNAQNPAPSPMRRVSHTPKILPAQTLPCPFSQKPRNLIRIGQRPLAESCHIRAQIPLKYPRQGTVDKQLLPRERKKHIPAIPCAFAERRFFVMVNMGGSGKPASPRIK